MSFQGARAALALSSILLAACGAKTLDFTSPDGGAGTTTGAGGTAGGTGTGGTAGDGGPSGPSVSKLQPPKTSKVDILFMIDNSSSMADKQVILSEAVPELVDNLMNPKCVDPITGRIVGFAINAQCPAGSELIFAPIRDIHVGIISSSLGAHGATAVCDDAMDIATGRSDPHNDDRGHLVTRGVNGSTVPTWENKGFLYYNANMPGAQTNIVVPFTDLVRGVGQHGCGYEASLEAVYRFLVDPDPYDKIAIESIFDSPHGQAVLQGTDATLLRQRADFLRPDSLVSIVLLTDENDCSIIDGGQGFYPLIPPDSGTGKSFVKRGTAMCLVNPNDRCCYNCRQQTPPVGCGAAESDPECQKGELTRVEDQTQLRCFNQKRRYGVDFLYPVQRYVDGFTKLEVPNRQGQMVPNPLFWDLPCPPGSPCAMPRDRSHVIVTGIVGVPWQDIAVDPNNLVLGYKSAQQLRNGDIWANIVGDPLAPTGPVAPRDTHMIESIQPRPGLAGPESPARADPIHGHEWDTSKEDAPNSDLQYACIFDLVPPKTCTESADCDCFGPNLDVIRNPLCQNQQGNYTTTQLRGKAYPGTRVLQVLQGIGDQAIVGSICPANVREKTREDYGFIPAVLAMIGKMRQPLRNPCLSTALPIDGTTGQTPCSVVEVFNEVCRCDAEPGRRMAQDALLTDEMKAMGTCRCEIQQLSGEDQAFCRRNVHPPAVATTGWCYVDPAQQIDAACSIVNTCDDHEQRRIHFLNANSEPRPGSTAFLHCRQPPIAPSPSRCP